MLDGVMNCPQDVYSAPLRPASAAANHEGQELVLADVVTQHLGALRVLADGHDDVAEAANSPACAARDRRSRSARP